MNGIEVERVKMATSRIVTKPPRVRRPSVATGVWVNAMTVITAGHTLEAMDDVKAEHPGKEVGHRYYHQVWEFNGKVSSYQLRVDKGNVLNDGPYENDIAILKSVGFAFGEAAEIDLDTHVPIGAKVAVLGYPSQYNDQWISQQHPSIQDALAAYHEALTLLPEDHLCVTYGDVTSVGEIQHYNISSAPGMSGGPVVYNGRVVGIETA